jgi:hypothetical protein
MPYLPGAPPNRYGSRFCVTRYIAQIRERRKAQFACQETVPIDFSDDRYIAGNCYRLDFDSFTRKTLAPNLPKETRNSRQETLEYNK